MASLSTHYKNELIKIRELNEYVAEKVVTCGSEERLQWIRLLKKIHKTIYAIEQCLEKNRKCNMITPRMLKVTTCIHKIQEGE